MVQLFPIAGLDLPDLDPGDPLHRLLSAALNHPLDNFPQQAIPEMYEYWDAEYFNLHQVKIFQQASAEEQAKILHLANIGLLTETYAIEKAGVGYMAKMVLQAETTEERMVYALFAADEAFHFAQIRQFLPAINLLETQDAFLKLLAEVVESEDKVLLLFVLQVVLEGWGLTHYRSLAKACHHPGLKSMFSGFLQQEARHHGTGKLLFNRCTVSADSQDAIAQILATFLAMIQVGPQRILTAIEVVKGHLSRSQRIAILAEIDTETHSGTRLNLLRSLMNQSAADKILQDLEKRESFQPFPPHRCV